MRLMGRHGELAVRRNHPVPALSLGIIIEFYGSACRAYIEGTFMKGRESGMPEEEYWGTFFNPR